MEDSKLDWQEAVANAIEDIVSRERVTPYFSRKAILEEKLSWLKSVTDSQGETPEQTLSRVLQELRDAGRLRFLDFEGTYEWIG